MENLLQFIDLLRYFGNIDTAVSFCQNMYWNTILNSNEHIINACNTVWNNTYLK